MDGAAPSTAAKARQRPELERTISTTPPPGPRGLPLVGVLPRIWRDPLGFFRSVAAEFGPLARIGNRKFQLYLLTGTDGIHHVLQGNAGSYWKGEGLAAAATVMGRGLATSHGELWRRQRRLIQPAFVPSRLHGFVPMLHETLVPMFDAWASCGGAPRDVLPEASDLVQRILFRGLFGSDCATIDTDALGRALTIANDHIYRSAWTLLPLPKWVPTPRRARFARAMALLDRDVYGLIRRHRSEHDTNGHDDLLGRLLAAADPGEDGGMTDEQIRDEVMTLFVAGHDTTAAGIAWCLHVLATEPGVRDRVAAEVADVTGGDPLQPAALASLDYTGRVVQEVLRLYPPGWILVRTPTEDDELCGYRIPAAAPILICPWVVHRDPQLWRDPERFDPDRFLPENAQSRPRYAYFPYGGGNRTCIGNHLADLVLRTVVAEAARRFRFEPVPRRTPTPQPKTTLQPKGGVWLGVHRAP